MIKKTDTAKTRDVALSCRASSARRRSIRFGVVILLTVLTWLCAETAVRNIGTVLLRAGEEQFGRIFMQIRHARLLVPVWIPAAVWASAVLLTSRFRSRSAGGSKRLPAVLAYGAVGLVLFIIVTALTVWFCQVNGIRLCDVIMSLMQYDLSEVV